MSICRFLILSTLVAGAIAAAPGCGDPSSVGVDLSTLPPPPPLAARARSPSGLVSCTPLPYDSVTQVIGPAGGLIVVGPHVLWVDTMALRTRSASPPWRPRTP